MEASSGEDDFVVLSLLQKQTKKTLGSSNPKTRQGHGGCHLPPHEGAAELSRLLPGVCQDVSGPV